MSCRKWSTPSATRRGVARPFALVLESVFNTLITERHGIQLPSQKLYRHVVLRLHRSRPIRRRRDPGELSELVHEVRLIGVAVPRGNIAPVDVSRDADRAQHALQSPDARIPLW